MISIYLLTKEQVAKALVEKGCTELPSPLPEHSAWRSPWGTAFLVPQVGPDLMTAAFKLEDIIEEIAQSKPDCH